MDKLPALPILAFTFSTFVGKLPVLSIIATVFPKSEDRSVFLQNQQMLFIYKSLMLVRTSAILVSKYSFLIKSFAIGFFKSSPLFFVVITPLELSEYWSPKNQQVFSIP